jgi:glucokinase
MNEMNSPAAKLVGVEVSGLMLKAAWLDENGALLSSTKAALTPEREISAQLVDFINELKSGSAGELKKIGLAVPGLLNRSTNRIAISKHIPQHTDIDLADEIKNKTGLEATLENDANAAAYGEYVLGAGRGSRDVFYVTLGTGVGGAFIFDGKLWRGAGGFAGELGYLTINSDGMTLEEVASADSIIRRTRIRVQQDHTSSLARIRELRISDIVEAANGGDAFSGMMLERTGSYIGTAIANVINLLNIEKIVIGGEVMETRDIVLAAINKSAKELSFKPSFETTRIVAGELGELASAIGAALLSAETNQQKFN